MYRKQQDYNETERTGLRRDWSTSLQNNNYASSTNEDLDQHALHSVSDNLRYKLFNSRR